MEQKKTSPRIRRTKWTTGGFALLLCICVAPAAEAQFLGVAYGRQFAETFEASPGSGTAGGPARSHFHNGGLVALDAGTRVFPFVTAGLHYSTAKTDLEIARGDSFGSRAEAELSAHTVTVDTRLRSPFVAGFRVFGLAGAGLTRFGLDVKREVESPFPGGTPDNLTSFVFTYGGGVERHLHQLVHLRLEVRNYRTSLPEELFRAGGTWNRKAVLGGITIGF